MNRITSNIAQSALSMLGFISLAFAFGDPQEGTTERQWMVAFLISFGVSAVCFYALYRILKKH